MTHSLRKILSTSAIVLSFAPSLALARSVSDFGINATTFQRAHQVRKLKTRSLRETDALRNEQRRTDIKFIFNALGQYMKDHEGNLPSGITEVATEICKTGSTDCKGYLDLATLLEPYLKPLPVDPLVKDGNGTGYAAMTDWRGRFAVIALKTEGVGQIKQSSISKSSH